MFKKIIEKISGKKIVKEEDQSLKKSRRFKMIAYMDGKIVPLENVPDEVFSSKMAGDGFAIEPINGEVISPVDGIISVILPTYHAIGIREKSGLEILVHFGIDTVNLKGEGLEPLVCEGDVVKAGQPILRANLDKIKDKVPSLITPVIFTNLEEGENIILKQDGNVNRGEEIIIIIE